MVGWLKSNWLILVCGVVLLAAPAAGFIVAGGMAQSALDEQQTEASGALRKVDGSSVTYEIPAATPDGEGLSLRRAPNEIVTTWVGERRQELMEQQTRVVEKAAAFNKREHAVLLEGLFPEPAGRRERQQLGFAMADLVVGSDTEASVYEKLLRRLNAGSPLDLAEMVEDLQGERERQANAIVAARGPGELSEAEQERIQRELKNRRLSFYRSKAISTAFYMDVSAITGVRPSGGEGRQPPRRPRNAPSRGQWSAIPSERPSAAPEPGTCFVWQWDYWAITDVLESIAEINRGRTLEDAPVKRIDRIQVQAMPLIEGSRLVDERGEARSEDGLAPRDRSRTITGRVSSPDNQIYDTRLVQIEGVFLSEELPSVLEAFGKLNFMTVVDVDVFAVDPWAELDRGYYWGTGHVVGARLVVETNWLRDWIAPLMPREVAEALGAEAPILDSAGGDDDF